MRQPKPEERALIHKDFRCDFYFIRHGESASNADPRFVAGVNWDAPLTGKGFEQAKALGVRMKEEGVKFDRVYSSTMARAISTAETMLAEMGEGDRDFPKIEAIMEQQIPGWRGVPREEVMTPQTVALMATKGSDFVGPQGESMRQVRRRVTNWLEDELIYNEGLTAAPTSMTVAIVGHGNALRCLYQYILGFGDAFLYRMAIDNTSIGRFIFDHRGWSVVRLNDAMHLGNAATSFESRT
ncbi:MAG: histidine phosphatase family protein [SAR202 cluster bacterium]|jgi:broad specificity phosphatase PhoE|nr:histidine phosphatase family protein [SAR202 cluster bacterium]MQG68149.1 histidine phosphatase family protein [SAR202 cluster bacterium]HAL46652.1 hypothetical protein [Dehalococcoidia bacterium]|tara:strand:+ start:1380 stop:2099 length:720 start_codon:yes stop_codon:yes gene_type:complete